MPDEQPSNAPTDSETEVTGVDPSAAQENVGRDNMAGSGEWPSPSTPPQSPVAPGDDAEVHRDGAAGASPSGPSGLKEAQERDPVAGGSRSVGDDS